MCFVTIDSEASNSELSVAAPNETPAGADGLVRIVNAARGPLLDETAQEEQEERSRSGAL